jgi:Glycolipid 2-alpha-mannosyltransferase
MPDHPPQRPRANATLLMLARNSDVDDAVRAVRELEDRFNHKYRYPWTFLNEQAFSDEFKRYVPLTHVLPEFVSSVFLTVVFTRTRIHAVAYRMSSRVPCILGRFPRSIGINLRGSMRPRRKRRERRWRERASFTVAVYRAAFLCSYSVSVAMTGAAHRYRNMCRFNSGVRFCPSLIRQ